MNMDRQTINQPQCGDVGPVAHAATDEPVCDYCDLAQPIDRAASRMTGLRICTFCLEALVEQEVHQ
jgi:hypothetical protein